jgi:hypothetical protein
MQAEAIKYDCRILGTTEKIVIYGLIYKLIINMLERFGSVTLDSHGDRVTINTSLLKFKTAAS